MPFSNILSKGNLIVLLAISLMNGVLLFFASMKFLLSLQQSGYRGKRYFKWLGSPETPYRSRLMLLSLLGFLFFLVLCTTFASIVGEIAAAYVGFASYLLFILAYIRTESAVNAKVPLKKTRRLIRLCISFIIVASAATFGLLLLFDWLAIVIDKKVAVLLRYSLICAMPVLTPYLLFVAYIINEPLEECIKRYYVRRAKVKLDKSNVLKIGITGSYGKTSIKEILRTILSQKYRVLATPASFNTPMGISLTVKNLDSTHDVFIAEMGARSRGDIKELASLVKPQYGVLTGLNNQHLETFGSESNIENTKFELFENLAKDGKGFFSADSVGTRKLYERFSGEKYLAGLDGKDGIVTAEEIKTGPLGMTFLLKFAGEPPVECSTVLLGRHSVSNICLAAAVAYKIGLSPEEIARGINRIQSIGHRLALMPNNKDIVIIDDSYNGNVNGVDAAMEVLDTFDGRKIVLTPGLVELGKQENLANLAFGQKLAEHADVVIIIGKHNAEMLISGLTSGGMDKSNIFFAKTLNKGNAMLNEMLKPGDVVLFENDLPDNYS